MFRYWKFGDKMIVNDKLCVLIRNNKLACTCILEVDTGKEVLPGLIDKVIKESPNPYKRNSVLDEIYRKSAFGEKRITAQFVDSIELD
ncbi:MAG: hypothetical protein WC942_07630 [Clostridia bacterium]|jgi:hypothetical protein